MNLEQAIQQASIVTEALRAYCVRIEVAGSVRRKKADNIKDVEIVLIPRNDCLYKLAEIINQRWGAPIIGKWPAKYTKIRGAFDIDIFTGSATNWGLLFFIRTGPAEYVMQALAHWKRISGGGCSKDCELREADGQIKSTPEEADVFTALQRDFLPPERRI